MYVSYRSPHPNYAHQIFVTPSKHAYILKDGRLKWQNKAMDVKLQGIASAEREHIVYYLLADHYSAAFYAEVHSSHQLPHARDFLLRAWRKKKGHFFHGLPQVIATPKVLTGIEPELVSFIEEHSVSSVEPTSGFQAGVHQIRNFEKSFANSCYANPMVTIAEAGPHVEQAMRWLNESCLPRAGATRRELWENGVALRGILAPT
jgi:hypothetical protein